MGQVFSMAKRIKTIADRRSVGYRDTADFKRSEILEAAKGGVITFTEKFDKGKPAYQEANPFNRKVTWEDFSNGVWNILGEWLAWSDPNSVGIKVYANCSDSAKYRLIQTAFNLLWYETSFRSSNFLERGHFGIWRSPNQDWSGIEIHPFFKQFMTPAIKLTPGSLTKRYLWVLNADILKDRQKTFEMAIAIIICWLCRTIDRFEKKDGELFEDLLYSAVLLWNPGYSASRFDQSFRVY